ncbi:MAG: hydroxymethylbilane synthase [Gemmatimonadetes bacterium]|nr:hydroxymethylbilane synthase [Gemmatimonadota bacterium]
MRTLRLGTRGSLLAMAQSRGVAAALEAANPGLIVELVEIHTSGDRIKDVPLGPHLGQAFFTKEIEDALLDGRVDLAVHSCKDLGTVLPEGLTLAAIPTREDPRDALVSTSSSLDALPSGSRVGTSSQRRKNFLAHLRPDLDVRDQRGNVPTRVRAVDENRMDAVVLALAGLRRLGLADRVVEVLAPEVMLPAAAQGALALETRSDDDDAVRVVQLLDDPAARAEVTAERACLRRLEAGCQAPVGALARWADGELTIRAAAVVPDGATWAEHLGTGEDAEGAGVAVADVLLRELGLTSLRDAPWAGKPPRAEPNEALREGTRAGETL